MRAASSSSSRASRSRLSSAIFVCNPPAEVTFTATAINGHNSLENLLKSATSVILHLNKTVKNCNLNSLSILESQVLHVQPLQVRKFHPAGTDGIGLDMKRSPPHNGRTIAREGMMMERCNSCSCRCNVSATGSSGLEVSTRAGTRTGSNCCRPIPFCASGSSAAPRDGGSAAHHAVPDAVAAFYSELDCAGKRALDETRCVRSCSVWVNNMHSTAWCMTQHDATLVAKHSDSHLDTSDDGNMMDPVCTFVCLFDQCTIIVFWKNISNSTG